MKKLIVLALLSTGCASLGREWKAFLNGNFPGSPSDSEPTYSERSNILPPSQRQYHRVTKQSLENEAGLDERSGSLWVMEGQGAYLFAHNIMRMTGDPIPITLEGDPKTQIESKVGVIKKLVDKIEARYRDQGGDSQPAAEGAPAEAPAPQATAQKPDDKKESDFKVAIVPTRIVERTADGNYRVKGAQQFNIGTREYKVIVTGIVRAEDFSEDGVSSTKLMDPKFDVVSARSEDKQKL